MKKTATVIRSRLSAEHGSALLIALMVMIVVAGLAAAAVTAAVQTNRTTDNDAFYKAASEAAEAGLQVATYRLNELNLQGTQGNSDCVGDVVEGPGTSYPLPSNGLCQSSTYTMGNGSQYAYYMSPVLTAGATCVGLTITSSDVYSRCITAVGTAGPSNGAYKITARSQIRTAAFAGLPLFQVAGVTGVQGVTISGNGSVGGITASMEGSSNCNSAGINMNGNASSQGIELGPNAQLCTSGGASTGPVIHVPLQTYSPVSPGNSATTNSNYRITNGLANPVVSPDDQASGNITYNPSTRVLNLSGQSTLVLGGGVYNFCQITASGGANLEIASGVTSQVFIDSPTDPGSGCASGTGSITFSGGAQFLNLNGSSNPIALQLYVYGDASNPNNSQVVFSGNAAMYGTLYAPDSNITLSGNGGVIGGVVGNYVTISGNGTEWNSQAGTIQGSISGGYYRTAWAQCSPTYSTSNPNAGCG